MSSLFRRTIPNFPESDYAPATTRKSKKLEFDKTTKFYLFNKYKKKILKNIGFGKYAL